MTNFKLNLMIYLKTHNVSFEKSKLRKEQFIEKLFEKHPEFKYMYDFSESLYINITFPIKIWCKKHQKYFWVEPSNMLTENSKCPWCTKEEKIYLSEEERLKLE